MVLQQFDTLTITLSSRDESISSALPDYASLRALTIPPGDSQVIIDLKSSIKEGLEGRMAEHLGTGCGNRRRSTLQAPLLSQ